MPGARCDQPRSPAAATGVIAPERRAAVERFAKIEAAGMAFGTLEEYLEEVPVSAADQARYQQQSSQGASDKLIIHRIKATLPDRSVRIGYVWG